MSSLSSFELYLSLKVSPGETVSIHSNSLSICFCRIFLHRRPQIGEVTCGGSPHLSCKRDQIKMRDYMDRRVTPPKRVTSPTWGPPHPCKLALSQFIFLCYVKPYQELQSLSLLLLGEHRCHLTLTLEVIVLGTGGKVETAGRHGISFSSFRASLRPNLCKFRKLVHIPPGHLSPFRSQWWGLVRTFARGNSSRSRQRRSFFNFSPKNMLI